jgi:hypothetical protein
MFKFVTLSTMFLVIGTMSTSAFAAAKRTDTVNWNGCNALATQRGVAVNERRSELGPSAWRQFMDSCLAGKIR